MKLLMAMDDTDNLESRGTGHLVEEFRVLIRENNWGSCDRITRHQLFVHPDVPYTSHNSTMCFILETEPVHIETIKKAAMEFLVRESAPGSDPGLAMVKIHELKNKNELIHYGYKAQREVLNKSIAYTMASHQGVHLSEHGGTGDGIIGALAGIGLRLSGNDGRFRGTLSGLVPGENATIGELMSHRDIDSIIAVDPETVPDEAGPAVLTAFLSHGVKMLDLDDEVFLRGKIKTIHRFHQAVFLIYRDSEGVWTNWTKDRLKVF